MPLDAKSDMSKIGLFSELGYVTVGDKYVACFGRPLIESRGKSKQMMTNCSKMRSGLQDGYFDSQFKRIFEGDTYVDQVRLRSKQRIEDAKKNIITWCGSGNYFGTLQGPIPALSHLLKPTKPLKPQGKNFYTSPSKKGAGYGYPLVSIGKDYSYVSSPYNAYVDIRKVLLPSLSHCWWESKSRHSRSIRQFFLEEAVCLVLRVLLLGFPYRHHCVGRRWFPYRLNSHINLSPRNFSSTAVPCRYLPVLAILHDFNIHPALGFVHGIWGMLHSTHVWRIKELKTHHKLLRGPAFQLSVYPQMTFDCNSGGMKCRTFNPFPHHTADPYETKVIKLVGVKPKLFLPTSGLKSRPVVSIVYLNVKRSNIHEECL
uniref:cilia-and flagella-associated protein 96-like n=1 Tax=Myxine glutinosa TaxID=7769 RepID=UPI00358E7D21